MNFAPTVTESLEEKPKVLRNKREIRVRDPVTVRTREFELVQQAFQQSQKKDESFDERSSEAQAR